MLTELRGNCREQIRAAAVVNVFGRAYQSIY
jgi:hypothetical protein